MTATQPQPVAPNQNRSKAPNGSFIDCRCEVCAVGVYKETIDSNEWWVKCDNCEQMVFCYQPMPHQLRFHSDPAPYKMYAGGYGSAKTSTCGAEFILLALNTPNGEGLVGAHTYPQLELTAKKQIIDMLPAELIENHNQSKGVLTLTNGYKIYFRSFDDEQKLRSLNLCHVWIEEANGTTLDIFTQLETRLRHHATDQHKILLSTNPDSNWIKTDFLLKSARIYGSVDAYVREFDDINKSMHTHIARTDMNTHLPPDYVEKVSTGKPDHWIRRYLHGSFIHAEGLVYPSFEDAITDEITRAQVIANIQTNGWYVYAGSDFGIQDPTTLLQVAIDPVDGTAYLYDEYVRNRVAVPTHAIAMKERMAHLPYGVLQKIVGDPSGKKRNINDRKSIFDHYAEYGIYYREGDNRIEAGIMKVHGYFEMRKLKILSSCVETIKEGRNYRYPETELGGKATDKPVDKDNHCMDTLRYIIQELPDDPLTLRNQVYGQRDVTSMRNSEQHLPHALQTEEDTFKGDWYNDYY